MSSPAAPRARLTAVAVTALAMWSAAATAAAAPLPAAAGTATRAAPTGPARDPSAPPTDEGSPVAVLAERAARPAAARLAAGVAELARRDPKARLPLIVVSTAPLPAGAVAGPRHAWRWPGGEHLTLVRVAAADAPRLAALPGVAEVRDARPGRPAQHAKTTAGRPGAGSAAAAGSPSGEGAAAATRGPSTQGATGGAGGRGDAVDGARGRGGRFAPAGWWDVGAGHGGREAWAMGFKGEGVTAAVLDTGVDFGHPDLEGAWAVYPDGHPLAGWPEALDPDGLFRYLLDATDDVDAPDATASGEGGVVALYQTAEVTSEDVGGETVHTVCVTPLLIAETADGLAREPGDEDCDTVVPASAGGTVRYGHHPDAVLGLTIGQLQDRPAGQGELPGVLAVDAAEPGVFDTVVIDLNGDHDFTNDPALTRDAPLAIWDADGDGVADVSGGLLTFIADGATPLPGSYLVGLEDDAPEAGSVVALLYDAESHGTACASNIVSRGVMGPPPGTRLAFDDLPDGRPAAVNPALAPAATLIGMGDVYAGDIHFELSWRFAALGADPDRDDDGAQVVSNSFGGSDPDDGWDGESRLIDWYVRHLAPEALFLVATGNAGPGYGSTSSPSPATGVDVGASDQFGAQSTTTIRRTDQITFGDLIPFGNRGPGASGRPGVGVTANGNVGWGAVPLNLEALSAARATGSVAGAGHAAQAPWAGTSRSTPVASAAAALTYQAFRAARGRWPTAAEAKAILFAGARFNGYDVFSTGAGTVDAGDSARIAAGRGGVYATPPEWTVGDWQGRDHGGFARVASPGARFTQAITLTNHGPAAIDARVTAARLVRTAEIDTSHKLRRAAESRGADAVVPDWLFALDRDAIPPGTDLLVVRGAMPNSDATVVALDDGRVVANGYDVGIVRHTDLDGDGQLWRDANGNGAVNHAGRGDSVNWAATEVDEGEFNRTTLHYGPMNGWAATMHHPLERWGDGLYVAVWHADPNEAVAEAGLQLRVETYAWQPWPWLVPAVADVAVPSAGAAVVDATVAVPADAPTGLYQGALFVDYDRTAGDVPVPTGGGYELPHKRVVVPVVVNVTPTVAWSTPVVLGGEAATAFEAEAPPPYRQGALYGLSDYSGAESGDWRFFFLDAPDPGPGRWWLLRTDWGGEPGLSHVGTGLFGPRLDRYTDPDDPDNADEPRADPDWYGPYRLAELARTQGAFDIVAPNHAPPGRRHWLSAPAAEGLHEVMVHSGFIDGYDVTLPFTTTVGSVRIDPPEIVLRGTDCATVTVESTLPVPGLAVGAGGLDVPEVLADQPIAAANDEDRPVNVVRTFAQPVLRLAVDLAGEPTDDLDLRLYFDANRNGRPEPAELIGASESPTAEEHVALAEEGAPGAYIVQIIAFALAADRSRYDLTIDAISGDDITAVDAPADLAPGTPAALRVCPAADIADRPGARAGGEGVLTLGPDDAPGILRVPVRWAPDGATVGRIMLPIVLRGGDWP